MSFAAGWPGTKMPDLNDFTIKTAKGALRARIRKDKILNILKKPL